MDGVVPTLNKQIGPFRFDEKWTEHAFPKAFQMHILYTPTTVEPFVNKVTTFYNPLPSESKSNFPRLCVFLNCFETESFKWDLDLSNNDLELPIDNLS